MRPNNRIAKGIIIAIASFLSCIALSLARDLFLSPYIEKRISNALIETVLVFAISSAFSLIILSIYSKIDRQKKRNNGIVKIFLGYLTIIAIPCLLLPFAAINSRHISFYFILLSALNWLSVSIIEEVFFRRIMLSALIEIAGTLKAVLMASLIFGLVHLITIPFGNHFSFQLIVYMAFLGIILCFIYIYFGLSYAVLFHALWNMISSGEFAYRFVTTPYIVVLFGIVFLAIISIRRKKNLTTAST
jgi:membrane protease YdiL (CAAX protease family)